MDSAQVVTWLVEWTAASMLSQEKTLLDKGNTAANALIRQNLEDAETDFRKQFGSNQTITSDELAHIRPKLAPVLQRLFDDVRHQRR
jgi:hypothetical protein